MYDSLNRQIRFQSCYAPDLVPGEDSSPTFGSGSEVDLFDPCCFSPPDSSAGHYEIVVLLVPHYLFLSLEV